MNIKVELLKTHITDFINDRISDFDIDTDKIADTTAILILNEIKDVIQNTDIYDDFDAVEQIVQIFEKYNIDAGSRHDL